MSALGFCGRSLVCTTLSIVVSSPALAAQAPASAVPLRWNHGDPGLTWTPCPPIFPTGCEVTVLQGNPGTGPSDVFLRVPADYTFPPHSHTSAEHIVLLTGVLHVTYGGGNQVELRQSTYSLVPAKAGHKAHCAVGGPCVMFIHFDSPIDAAPAPDVP